MGRFLKIRQIALGLLALLLINKNAFAEVYGYVDAVVSDKDGYLVAGWACDIGFANSIDIHLYAGGPYGTGEMVAAATANLANEPAVNSICRAGGSHRYNLRLSPAAITRFAGKSIYVHALSISGGYNLLLQRSGVLSIPNISYRTSGYLDRVALEGGGVRIQGWTCQMNTNQSNNAQIYIGGPAGTGTLLQSFKSNTVQRPDVNKFCGTPQGTAHGFSLLIPKLQAVQFVGKRIYLLSQTLLPGIPDSSAGQSGKFAMPGPIPFLLSELAKPGENLNIPLSASVQIDSNVDIGAISVAGKLFCPSTGDFTVKTTGINVMGDSALFECGTQASPFAGKLRIALKPGYKIMGTERTFMVMNGGTLRLTGLAKNSQWGRISGTVQPGEQQIRVPFAPNWSVGDQIVISPSNYDYREAEQVTIDQVLENNTVFHFKEKLKYQHWGAVQKLVGSKTWILDERAEVANLTRNIVIYADGDESTMDYRGGHVMLMRGARGYVDSVEFFRMGRMGEMARYPFHWHRSGDVAGQYIINSSIHRSFQRCITVHGTHNSLVRNNVCYDHFGHGFFLEDGDETGNKFHGNLGILSKRPLPGRNLLQSDINTDPIDRFPGPATFWISNPKNSVAGNIAAGSQGSGFWMSFRNGIYCEPGFCQMPDDSHHPNVFPAREPTLQFDDNRAHSVSVGMAWDGVEEGPLTNNPNNPSDRHLITVQYGPSAVPNLRNLTVYKSSEAAMYLRTNTMNFDNFVLADNRVSLFSAYNQVVTNSLIVAISNNHRPQDFDINPDFTGVRVYDGPYDLRTIDFFNFPSQPISYNGKTITPTPILEYGGANSFTHAVQGLRFVPEPVRRIDFANALTNKTAPQADSIHSIAVRDVDGSLAGKVNSILVPDYPYNDDSSCTPVSGTSTLRCQYQKGVFLFLSIRNNVAWERTDFVVRRSDGVSTRSFEELKTFIYNMKFGVILGDRYDYDLTFSPNWQMPGGQSGGNWWPNSFQIIFQSEVRGLESPIVSFTGMGNNCSILGAQRVYSLNNLRATRGVNAFYTVGPKMYAKFISDQPESHAGSDFAKAGQSGTKMFQCAP